MLKFPYKGQRPATLWKRVREFLVALTLLGSGLLLALSAREAGLQGNAALAAVLAAGALLLAAAAGVLCIPRLARRIDFSSWRMPWTFSITREGALYIVFVFILATAAINSGNNLLFLILAMLLSAIVTSGLIARNSLRAVSVSMRVPENVFEGERVTVKVSLRNQKRVFPSFSISVEDLSSISQSGRRARWKLVRRASGSSESSDDPCRAVLRHRAYFPYIPPREIRSELVFQTYPNRGRYSLDGYMLTTRFPFGLFQRGERSRASGEVIVYPSIREIAAYFHLLPFLPGMLEGQQPGHGESLYSIRRYQEGESARIVDWKATAKTGEIMAREYTREEENRFCLILDTLIFPPDRHHSSAQFEKAVSFAASLAAHFVGEGAELEFLSPQEHQPRGSGLPHLYRILRSLALAECRPAHSSDGADLFGDLCGPVDPESLRSILSEKTYKLIVTSRPKRSIPSAIWRSSHVVYFDEL